MGYFRMDVCNNSGYNNPQGDFRMSLQQMSRLKYLGGGIYSVKAASRVYQGAGNIWEDSEGNAPDKELAEHLRKLWLRNEWRRRNEA